MKIIGRCEAQFRTWIKEYGHFILVNLIFGVLVYFTMMSESLVNSNDGLLYTSYYNAGAWQASCGRGMLYYLDKMRSGVISVSLNSSLTIAAISIAGIFILKLFSIKEKWTGFVVTMVLIANPITCATLSHCYVSVNFGITFLLSVLTVYSICIYRGGGVLLGGLFLAVFMGCYQAYFSVTCLLILMVFIQKLLQNDDGHNIARFLIRSIFTIATGGCLYYIFTKLMLLKFNIGITDYKGASSVSLKTIIFNLKQSIPQCYINYYNFFRTKMGLNSSSRVYIFLLSGICSMAVFCVIYHFCMLWKKNWRNAIFFAIAVCLVPIGSSAITIIVLGGNSTLISMGFLLSIILLIVLVPREGKISFLAQRAYFVLMFFLLWNSILSVTNEQLALKEGKRASVALAEVVLNELIAEDCLEEGYTIVMIGKAPGNDLFAKREAWQKVYGETRFGDGWHNQLEFWRELFTEYCGVHLNFCTYEQYNTLSNMKEVANMPNFPAKGSIVQIDGVTVVKISDDY